MTADGFSYCPQCGAEYRVGFTHCADCGVALVDTPPPPRARDAGRSRHQGPIVELMRLPSRFEADVIIAKLQDAGVRVVLGSDDAGGWYPHLGLAEGHRVLVAQADVDLANDVLGPRHRAALARRRRRPS